MYRVARTLVFHHNPETIQDHLLLLQRNPDDRHRPGQWDLPGGSPEDNESMVVGAARELAEEAGIVALPEDLCEVMDLPTPPADKARSRRYGFYVLRVPEDSFAISSEHTAGGFFPVGEALRMMQHSYYRAVIAHVIAHSLADTSPQVASIS